MKRLVICVAAIATVLLLLEAVPASAAAPRLSATRVHGSPDDFWFFIDAARSGWVSGCDRSTIQVTALGITYGYGDLDWVDVYRGTNNPGDRYGEVDFGLTTTDPASQPQAADFTDVSVSCTSSWRTSSYVRRAYHGSVTKLGRETSSRSWSRLSLGGNCNYGGQSGRLLVTCLWARSTVTYNLTAPRGSRITGASASMNSGLYACHTSVAKQQTSKRTIRLTTTTSNASGFAQCWINRVSASYKGTHRVKVWTAHQADRTAEWHLT